MNTIKQSAVSRPNGSVRPVPMGEKVALQVGSTVAHVAIMMVGPELAREWLEKEHEKNRRTPSVTARYTSEMKSDGWKFSPQPVVISDEGDVIDGGNRLRAIVDSGCTVPLTVWFNWPADAFTCLDRNAPRTLFQADQMCGEAMPRAVYQMSRALILVDENRTTIGDTEIRAKARALLPAWNAIGPSLSDIRVGRHGLRAPAVMACCVAWITDAQCVERFVAELKAATEREITPSAPIRNFLRWYENAPLASGTYGAKDAAFGMAAALRQFATKANLSMLKATDDAYAYWRDRPQVADVLSGSAGATGG